MAPVEGNGNSSRSGGGKPAPMSEFQRTLVTAAIVGMSMIVGGGIVYLVVVGRNQSEHSSNQASGGPSDGPVFPMAAENPTPAPQPARGGQPARSSGQRGNPAPAPAAPVSSDPYIAAIDARLTQLDKWVGAKNQQSTQQAVNDLKKWVQEDPRKAAAVLSETWPSKNIVPRLVKDCKAYQQTIDLIDEATASLKAGGNTASMNGGIGLGTYDTQAEYRNIRVEKNDGTLLYLSGFDVLGTSGWKPDSGTWDVAADVYRPTARGTFVSYYGSDESWSDYTLTLQARKIVGKEGFLIVFGHKGHDRFWWNIGGWSNTETAIEFNGLQLDVSLLGAQVPCAVDTNRWYDIKMQVSGSQVSCYLDGKLMQQVTADAATLNAQLFQGMRHWKAAALIETGHAAEAAELIKMNFAEGWTNGAKVAADIVTPLANRKANTPLLQVTQSVLLASPDDSATVESILNQRISALHASQKYAEALAEAKVLFNYATMEHTSDALKTLDREIQQVNNGNKAQVDLFHKEQEQGAAAPASGQTFKSTVLAGIKIDGASYTTQGQSLRGGDYPTLIKQGSLMLLADQGDHAVETFKKALATAKTPEEKQAANTWIARAIKAQDGTIGRANQWITSAGK